MAEIIQLDPGQFGEMRHSAAKVEPKSRDAVSVLLLVLSVVMLITAVSLAAYTLLLRIFPQLSLPFLDASMAVDWPFGLQIPFVLGIGFALLALMFYLAARWRLTHNESLQAIAGCLSCQQHELLRISRTRRDRLMTLSGIRVARYQCRNCQWNGRRIFRTAYHPLETETVYYDPNAGAKKQPESAPAAEPAQASVQPAVLVIESVPDVIEEDKPAVAAAVLVSSSPNDLDAIATAPPEAKSNSQPLQEPVQAATQSTANVTVSDSKGAEPVKTTAVIAEPQKVTPPSTPAAENLQPVEAVAEGEAEELVQDQTLISSSRARVITTFGVNLRAGPRADAKWVGLLGPKKTVKLLRNLRQEDGTIWYYVRAGEQSGWVMHSNLKAIK